MMNLIELFDTCNNRRDYVTVKREDGKKKYEVDYKFVEEDDILYIFFEPSDGRTDWKVNFSYWRKPYADMEISYRVHGGFLESWKLIKDTIRAKVTERDYVAPMCEDNTYAYKWHRIIIAGYSHGGALAALCHECVWYEREDLRNIKDAIVGISFDGPRVFAGLKIPAALKERWAQFYVFRNHSDIVTHLPPVIFFFRHVGNKVRIGVGENPGWISAHYPDNIRASLEDFMENGKNSLRENIVSAIQGIGKTASEIAERFDADGDRDLDADAIKEKIGEIVKNKIEK